MSALTDSGAGLRIEESGWPARLSIEQIERTLAEARFLVLRGVFPTLADVLAFLRRLGPLNEASTRQDGVVMVDAAARNEVFRSNAALPLHKDGILTGFDVSIVGIYCLEWQQVSGGRTIVSDASRALATVREPDVEILRTHGFEALAIDRTGYYREEFTQSWVSFPAFRARPGMEPTLHVGLPHEQGEPESWRVRVPGIPADRSDRVLQSLRDALLDPRFVYRHEWRSGDLLLLDNYAVLHGREAFHASARRLANLQVLAV